MDDAHAASAGDVAPRRAPNTERKRPLSRNDWIQAGLRALAKDGVEAVRVEPIADTLGVTKGSFYWHFKDRGALLGAILAWWEESASTLLIERVVAAADRPKDRLWEMFQILNLEAVDIYDPAVRGWARQDKAARRTVARVDERRLAFIESLFRDLGFDLDQVVCRARVVHFFQIGEYSAGRRDAIGTRIAEARMRLDLLTSGAPAA